MNITSISSIQIAANRQRQEFDPQALMELTESIRERGLLHAPVCREVNGVLTLVAGERRLRAIKDLFALGGSFIFDGQSFSGNEVPYVNLGELAPLEAEEAELDENLHRRDLSWQEHASAVQRLHELRKAQAEARGDVQTVADTALEVLGRNDGHYQATIRKESIVAKHLNDPDVAKAKTLDEGFKILKRKEENRKNAELAVSVGKTFSVKDHEVFNQDCLAWMAACPPETFDVILTDPPYGMGADTFCDAGGKMTGIEHHYDDSYESWVKLMAEWSVLSFTVCKPQAHAYVWCDIDNFHELKRMMQAAGWYVFRTPLINVKTGSGRVPLPDRGPRRQYETCLYAIKGNKPVTHIYPDVITSGADQNDGHGATKPVSLYTNLLQRSVRPGDRVLDCFAGSGPIFHACHLMKVYATGIEQNPEYYGICLKRLQKMEMENGES
jgi:DNA modification methylase